MGRARILESIGAGEYKIQYEFDTVLVDKRIAAMKQSLVNIKEIEIPAQQAIIDTASDIVGDLEHDLNVAIGEGITENIKQATSALNQGTTYLDRQKREMSLLNLRSLGLSQKIDFAEKYRKDPIVTKAWCADYSANIVGEVGTIELVSSTQHPVIIRPGGIDGDSAAFQAIDGVMASPESNDAFGWLFNTMMLPGHQKWFSRYRVGNIIAFHTDDPNMCNVVFDEEESEELKLDINQQASAYNLPIEYLECNAEAFKLGDRVVVEHEEDKGPEGERGVYKPVRVIGFESHPRPCGLSFIIWAGSDTIDYNRKYYALRRGSLSQRESLDHLELVDDGKYSIIWGGVGHLDPDDYSYRTLPTEGDGIRVPETDTGRDTKKQDGNKVRFMTNQSIEDELWIAYQIDAGGGVVYDFLGADDSLTRAPYKLEPKASVCRYTTKGEAYNDFGVLTFNRLLEAGPGIILVKAWHTNSFGSAIPIIDRGYTTRFDGTREYIDLAAEEPEASAICCAVGSTLEYSGIQRLIRGEAFKIGIADLAEPLTSQKYNFRDKDIPGFGFMADTDHYYRSWDESTNDVYMIDANTIYGKVVNEDGYTTTSGQQYINNDITLPYGMTEDDRVTFVRKEKDTEFTMANAGLYVAARMVEESGIQDVIKLWGDGELPAEHNAPILIRQMEYHPLQVHHGKSFDVVLFRRIVYKSYETELLPYKILRVINATLYYHAQVRRTIITSETQYAVAVNGKITDLPYTTTTRESRLSVLSEEYTGPPVPLLSLYALGPWIDIGYDKDGFATEEDNTQLTRIFVSEAGGTCFVGFDAFPIEAKHDLVTTGTVLHPAFDAVLQSFPPYIDLEYVVPKSRRWLLFDTGGSMTEDLDPPTENRINGVSMLDPRG